MEKLKPLLPFFLVAVVAIAVIVMLFPTAHPYGGIALPLNDNEIIELSKKTLNDLGINYSALTPDALLSVDKKLVRQTQEQFGLERSNTLLRESIPGYIWEVRWRKINKVDLLAIGDEKNSQAVAEKVSDALFGDVFLQYDTQGRLLRFDRKIKDSTAISSLSADQAKALASSFLKRFSSFGQLSEDTVAAEKIKAPSAPENEKQDDIKFTMSDEAQKKIERSHRSDFEYNWSTTSPELKDQIVIKVTVTGNLISLYSVEYKVPDKFTDSTPIIVQVIIMVIVYCAIVIIMIVLAFKLFRSFEIGFRMGVIAGILVGCIVGIEAYIGGMHESIGEIILRVLFASVFMGGILIPIWAVGESLVREIWKEKFISLDLLSKGYIVQSRIGESIIRGIGLGLGMLALWLILTKIAGFLTHPWIGDTDSKPFREFSVFSPALYVIGHSIYVNAFYVSLFVMFSVSLLRKRIASAIVLNAVGAGIFALLNREGIQPLPIGMGIEFAVGILVVWTFYQYDALAAFIALFTYTVAQNTAALMNVGHPVLAGSGYTLIGFFGLLLIGSVASLYRKNKITDFDSITPAFARHITERQRLQQELEIARQVQMSFLPKSNPTAYRLDIASRCAPALEVGGDYYDFIELGPDRLGVAVGDVSGKGTQAAFFMTLTKGFLRALAKISDSPSAVLSQVNKLFYENVERGVFISMVYGIFDTKGHTITLARAGHNPVIMRSTTGNDVQVVNPMGLALGLDAGEAFNKSIQEVTIPFQQGDLFVFYTDGFPEAMNKTMEEFGEDRLCQTVQQLAQNSAVEIMNGIFAEMKRFVGKAKQHDDMTIVVVKVA
ncbi:MAG: PP2C family protein-serine/threonine phosphatase [Ignavibacteriales bacterium]|nr:PP2C family protein-serine/threonine phosphatase [Ignavibacteriales bacterium]